MSRTVSIASIRDDLALDMTIVEFKSGRSRAQKLKKEVVVV